MADKLEIHWDKAALGRAVGLSDETLEGITQATNRIAANAQSMSAGFRTKKWHDHATGETKGDTPTNYVGDVQTLSNAHVGIVYTGNYSAYKDNLENNTLLKSVS